MSTTRHLLTAAAACVAVALSGCGSDARPTATTPATTSVDGTPTASPVTSAPVTTAPVTTTTRAATPTATRRPTTAAARRATTTRPPATPSSVAPATPTKPPAPRPPAVPSLRGDVRNSWAFVSLQGGDITVEGTVPSHKAWSTSKVLVVAAFLKTVVGGRPDRLTSSQRSLVTRALSASDMDALIALRGQIPGAPNVPMNQILRSVGDQRTIAPDTNQGGMQWAPVDQVRFLRGLWRGTVVSRAASAYLMEQMNPIPAHEWGLGTVGARNFKGGWYRSTTVTRQMGFLRGYAVVIITDHVGPAVRQTDGDDAHVQQMNYLAGRLNQRLQAEATR